MNVQMMDGVCIYDGGWMKDGQMIHGQIELGWMDGGWMDGQVGGHVGGWIKIKKVFYSMQKKRIAQSDHKQRKIASISISTVRVEWSFFFHILVTTIFVCFLDVDHSDQVEMCLNVVLLSIYPDV